MRNSINKCRFSIILISALALSACANIGANADKHDACQNLHKVEGIDDLLAQMYANIDSHCLFNMPTETLEEIWGIKIFDLVNLSSEEREEINKERKKYYETENSLYLVKAQIKKDDTLSDSGEYFFIAQTEKFGIWGGSILEKGRLSALPIPDEQITSGPSTIPSLHFLRCVVPEENRHLEFYFSCNGKYIWRNHRKSKKLPYLHMITSYSVIPGDIKFCKTNNCY